MPIDLNEYLSILLKPFITTTDDGLTMQRKNRITKL